MMLDEIVQRKLTLTLRRSAFAKGKQTTQSAVCSTIRRIYQHGERRCFRLCLKLYATSDNKRDADVLRGDVGADDAGQRVAISDRGGAMPKCSRLLNKLLGMTGSMQEREITRDVKFNVSFIMCAFAPGVFTGG